MPEKGIQELSADQVKKTIVPSQEALLDIYANATAIYSGGYDLTLRFLREGPNLSEDGIETMPVVQVRLSHGQAWTMAYLILRTLATTVEKEGRTFLVPADVVQRLGLEQEYHELEDIANGKH